VPTLGSSISFSCILLFMFLLFDLLEYSTACHIDMVLYEEFAFGITYTLVSHHPNLQTDT
jgi:hypothetical protein